MSSFFPNRLSSCHESRTIFQFTRCSALTSPIHIKHEMMYTLRFKAFERRRQDIHEQSL